MGRKTFNHGTPRAGNVLHPIYQTGRIWQDRLEAWQEQRRPRSKVRVLMRNGVWLVPPSERPAAPQPQPTPKPQPTPLAEYEEIAVTLITTRVFEVGERIIVANREVWTVTSRRPYISGRYHYHLEYEGIYVPE